MEKWRKSLRNLSGPDLAKHQAPARANAPAAQHRQAPEIAVMDDQADLQKNHVILHRFYGSASDSKGRPDRNSGLSKVSGRLSAAGLYLHFPELCGTIFVTQWQESERISSNPAVLRNSSPVHRVACNELIDHKDRQYTESRKIAAKKSCFKP